MATTLTDTQGIIAIAACAVAIVAAVGCLALALALRKLRREQKIVLGEMGQRDVVGHAADLQDGFNALTRYSEDVAARLDQRLAGVEAAMDRTITHRALVRYDAYNELSGRQSMSIALLDGGCSGIVLSCITHRDQARVYATQVHEGRAEQELSPEEHEAVRLALNPTAGADRGDVAGQPAS